MQLPLYAGFALDDGPENAGGLVFAQIRAGKHKEFLGRVKDARATLMSGLSANTALVKHPLTDDEMRVWRTYIEEIARDFVAGRAELILATTRRPANVAAFRRSAASGHPPQTDDENGDTEEAADA